MTKVLLIDDHKILREGLRALLESWQKYEIVGEAASGAEGIRFAQQLAPDVAIVDINLPDIDGVEVTRQILNAVPQIKVLGLSIHRNHRFVMDMLKAGALGYLSKGCDSRELSHALQTVVSGGTYISSDIAGGLVDTFVRENPKGNETSGLASLNDREIEVIRLIGQGKTTKEIASHIQMSTKTVDACRRHCMEKLGAQNLASLIKFAIREGLTELD